MRSVTRSAEPEFFDYIRSEYSNWNNLESTDHSLIRRAVESEFAVLGDAFANVCAYCERPIESSSEWEIDHFRPRDRFPSLWADWLNLVYSCHRCNNSKGNKWPGVDEYGVEDVQSHQWLSRWHPRYRAIPEYVSPNNSAHQRLAGELFDFDVETGEIRPAESLDDSEWSMALRTIRDIDLDDVYLGENDPNHLRNLRQAYLADLLEEIATLRNSETREFFIRQYMSPGQPFSGFVAAYFRS